MIKRPNTLVRMLVVVMSVVVSSVALPACSASGSGVQDGVLPAGNSLAPFSGHGSIDDAYELGARPGTQLHLFNSAGVSVGSGIADRFGSLIVRNIAPGNGYTFRSTRGTKSFSTKSFRVMSPNDIPPESFYSSQHMHVGLNYITMRDGIKLAATVRLPPGKTLANGPFPTVIEYSGYSIAAPHSLINAILHGGNMKDPLLPSTATVVGSAIAPLLGFATVSLQMRGTGCSGGAFDLFGLPTTTDGYDAVQIVASQPWVAFHKVGMVGISFSGISQLFVAGARPPGLAAIAPLSVTNDLYATGEPGGILNSGFAASWLEARQKDAEPAPGGGQAWASAEIAAGDKTCLANQDLRLQTQNVMKLVAQNPLRTPSLFNPRSPALWAKKINVPVFLGGALQDEETGPQWPDLIPNLAHDPHVWVSMVNGTHVDSLGPGTITRWLEFLDIFVAHRVPTEPSFMAPLAGKLYQMLTGAPSGPLPALRFTNAPNVNVARAEFESQTPRVRVLFDNGAGSAGPGAMQPVWSASFASWPPRRAVVTTLHLGTGGALSSRPGASSTVSFRPNPAARPATDLLSGGNVWAALPPYNWTPVTGSVGLGFITPPLAHDEVVVGPASLNLLLKSSAANTDLQVTVSEVRPNGQEMYVTSGFLRASDRALNTTKSTALHPVPTYLHSQPMPSGRFVEVRIPIDPIGYAFRAGSRLRITITAPGGDRPEWAFATPATNGKVLDTVALGAGGSTLVIPVVPGITPPDPQPPCPSLRGEPCRTYVPAGNGG
ncbi:MAG: CocE/NonD family hydrolase [Acidimicrobiales bacterium]